jgi:DNA-binding NtrC family response regulator
MTMERASVLVVDDKPSVLELMASILGDSYEVTTAEDPARAVALLGTVRFDVVMTDVRMPGSSGFDVLAAVRAQDPDASVVMMTGYASIPDAVTAIRRGAFDYVAKPLEAEDVRLVVARALEHRRERAREASWADPRSTDFHEALVAARDQASRVYLVRLMEQFRGNVTRAAEQARMTRENLHRLLKRYGVRSDAFKT